MYKREIEADVVVVGGGMAGLCAAVASARRGASTVLIHDRPVLGGNASSEVRMWICGARGTHAREGGLLEEIKLDNARRNPGL
ncbi:MAG: FAD-dependent oxidoreductase, partial [Planctomycetota bacterium]